MLEGIDLQNPPTFSLYKTNVAALRIRILKSMASCMIKAKSLDPTLELMLSAVPLTYLIDLLIFP